MGILQAGLIRRFLLRIGGVIGLVVIAGCATPERPDELPVDLAHDAALFGPPVDVPNADAFLAVDETMRAFVAETVGSTRAPHNRLDRLMQNLFRPGEYAIDYETDRFLTASQTYHARGGNCLSTTALFIAMAREAGLDARFQDFDRIPGLRIDQSTWVHERHINAVIFLGRNDLVTVDFDRRRNASGVGKIVDDRVATAQFFSNLGTQAIRQDDPARAIAYFQRAIELAPNLAYVWNNIGVFYNRTGHRQRAEAVFRHAVALDPDEVRALSNLVTLLQQSGRLAEAADLRRTLDEARGRDPYYLYLQARRSLELDRPEESLDYLQRAIELNADEPAFQRMLDDLRQRMAAQPAGGG